MKPPPALRFLPRVAYRVWFTPPPLAAKAAARDQEAVEGLTPITVPLPHGGTLDGYQTGEGPLVLALHGWGGRSAQMSRIARRLADDGMRVVAVNLPGRAGGPPVDIKEVAAAIGGVVEAVGTPSAVVAHSFAGLAMRLLDWEPVPPVVVMVAPVVKVSDALAVYSDRTRLLPWTRAGLYRRLRDWDPKLYELIDQVYPDQFPGADLLILHDPADPDALFASSAELAVLRPSTKLVPMPCAGHNRILRHPDALEQMARFLAERVGAHSGIDRRVASEP